MVSRATRTPARPSAAPTPVLRPSRAFPVLRLSLGELSGELLGSQRVVPKRLQDAGFSFRYPGIAAALAAELAAQN